MTFRPFKATPGWNAAMAEYEKGPKSPPQPAVSVEQCEHGVRHPHPCDDCLDRDIPRGKSLSDHPCYGIFATAPTEFSHRAYMTNHSSMYCERCGTELDRDKKQKAGAPLCWEPRVASSAAPPADGVLREALIAIRDWRLRDDDNNPNVPEDFKGSPFDYLRKMANDALKAAATKVEITDNMVREAMQTAWDDFCDDAQAIPGDIYREGGKTFFRAGTWADHPAMHLRTAIALRPADGDK